MNADRLPVIAIVPTFMPDPDLIPRLQSLAKSLVAVVVSDDSPERCLEGRTSGRGVHVLESVGNRGIASALNRGILFAIELHPDIKYVLTLDQDTRIENDQICDLVRSAEMRAKTKGLCITGVGYFNGIPLQSYRRLSNIEPVAELIQSGTLYPLQVLQRVGLFMDELFIDCVDTEMCLRARSLGVDIIAVTSIDIVHPIGSGRVFRIGSHRVLRAEHSSLRRFYITRNRIGVIRAYWLADPVWALRSLRRLAVSLVLIVLEERRLEKFAAAFRGFQKSGSIAETIRTAARGPVRL